MGVFFPGGERREVTYADVWGAGDDVSGAQSMTGESVTFATVIGLDAVAGAVGLMCDIVSMVPFKAYRDRDDVAQVLPSQPMIVADPSPTTTTMAWRAQAVVSWMLWGNLYGLVVSADHLGYPTKVELLDPAQVTCVEHPPARPTWLVAGAEVDPSRFLHVPGRFVRPGSVLGIAPLERHRDTYGLALAARRYGAEWFRDGAHHDGIFSTDKPVTEDQSTTIKSRILAVVRKRREPLVLGGGFRWEKTQGNPSESQMVEVEAAVVGRIARIMGVPVEMIGGSAGPGTSITYANREQRAVDLLTYNVDPYLVRLEDLLTRCLPRPQYAKATRGALLRTDLLTRYRAHDIAIRGGFATPNERRALEDEPPLPDSGDVALWPPYATSVTATDQGGQP